MPWDRHIYWEERKHRERESIEKSLRHEDIIYFTFLLWFTGIVVTILWYFHQSSSGKQFDVVFAFVSPVLAFILILILMRFVGAIFELLWLRYFSVHGLFLCLILYSSLVFVYLLDVVSRGASINFTKISIFAFVIIVFVIFYAILQLIAKLLENKLSQTNKYSKFVSNNRDKLKNLYFSFYMGIIIFLFFIWGLIVIFRTSKIDFLPLILLILISSIYFFYYFYNIKNDRIDPSMNYMDFLIFQFRKVKVYMHNKFKKHRI